MVAYQPGNAANIPAPATISHTSLPSQTGAMVPSTVSRAASVRPRTPCSMPTPKSKPSRTRKPTHTTAMTMNQNSTRDIAASVGELEDVGALPLLVGGRLILTGIQLPAGIPRHEPPVEHREDGVEDDEDDQAGDDPRRSDVGRVGLR